MNQTGFQAELAYAIGLCYYQQRQYGPALKHIAEIIERGVREHPELSVRCSRDVAGTSRCSRDIVRGERGAARAKPQPCGGDARLSEGQISARPRLDLG